MNPDSFIGHGHGPKDEDCERAHIDEFVAQAVNAYEMHEQAVEQEQMNPNEK